MEKLAIPNPPPMLNECFCFILFASVCNYIEPIVLHDSMLATIMQNEIDMNLQQLHLEKKLKPK